MSDTRYMTIARRFVEDIFNSRETDLAKNYVTSDIIYHGMGEEVTGLENFKRWVAEDLPLIKSLKLKE
jgi:hypothetical protein